MKDGGTSTKQMYKIQCIGAKMNTIVLAFDMALNGKVTHSGWIKRSTCGLPKQVFTREMFKSDL